MLFRLIGCVAAVSGLMMSSAFAADMSRAPMPTKALPVSSPAPSWTGFYLGVVGGYGWTKTNINAGDLRQNNVGGLTPSDINPRGGLIGFNVGYNWQVGSAVFGVEGDYSWSGIKRSMPLTINYTNALGNIAANMKADLTYIATLRGRLGYAFDTTLLYVTGGFATGKASGQLDANILGAALSFGDSQSHRGWVIGGGAEMMLAPNWTAKAEVLYIDLAERKYAIGGGNVPVGIGMSVTTVRAGLNYKF